MPGRPGEDSSLVPRNVRWDWHRDIDYRSTILTIRGYIGERVFALNTMFQDYALANESHAEAIIQDAVKRFFHGAAEAAQQEGYGTHH